jgi:DNA-binding response OmpR family regulator
MTPRILIIDDDEMLARTLGRMLPAFTVSIETDPCRAVARIREGERFEIVVCDLNMPGMNGDAVLVAIRAHFDGSPDAPHLIMTSGSDEVLALGAIADVVLVKPFQATRLRAEVSGLLASTL